MIKAQALLTHSVIHQPNPQNLDFYFHFGKTTADLLTTVYIQHANNMLHPH